MIFEELAQDGCPLASCAAVCRDWQAVFEPKTFARLTITQKRAAAMNDIVGRHSRRRHVKYILFWIKLPAYGCSRCNLQTDPSWYKRETAIIKGALKDFLRALSTWQPGGDLLLDITIHSPSDSKHWFKAHHYGSDAVPTSDGGGQSLARTHDPHHGWIHGRQGSHPLEAVLRVYKVLIVQTDQLPKLACKAPAVTRLLFRRQSRIHLYPEFIAPLCERLPNLEEVHCEFWRGRDRDVLAYTDFCKS